MKLRLAHNSDVTQILAIHNTLFTYNYSYDNYASEIDKDYARFYVLENKSRIFGFFIVHILFEKLEIIMLAISSEFQNEGYGKFLLDNIVLIALKNACTIISLEVSDKNKSALEFYKKNKFNCSFVRYNYYGKGEDAIIMERDV